MIYDCDDIGIFLDEGVRAHKDGLSQLDNPYLLTHPDSERTWAWAQGWKISQTVWGIEWSFTKEPSTCT